MDARTARRGNRVDGKFFRVVADELCEAIRIFVRYDVPFDKSGETRRKRNENFSKGELSPDVVIPDDGQHIWDWYFELSNSLTRVRSGVCEAIPWSEYKAWIDLTQVKIDPEEIDMLRYIDAAFCSQMNVELQEMQEVMNERAKRDGERSAPRPVARGKRR